jgi:hypothetical protein
VYVGTDEITVDQLNFDTAAAQTLNNAGEMAWDVDRETVALRLDSQLSTYLNQDSLYHVVNQTGVTISKGTVVGAVGTLGVSGKILIAPYQANQPSTSQRVMGVTSENIADGAEGFVQHFGLIRGINTSAFADGDLLWASSTVAGGFATTPPVAPNNKVLVALVIAAANNGVIFVRPTFGSSLANDELVNLSGLADNDLLQYDSATGVFLPVAPTPGLVGAYPDTNPSSFVDAAGASAAAPVQSVDSLTGAVDLVPRYAVASDTAPVSPFVGQRWVQTSTGRLAYWTGSEWVEIGALGLDLSVAAADPAFTGAFAGRSTVVGSRRVRSNYWVSPIGAITTGVYAEGVLRSTWLCLLEPITIDRIATRVSTAGAANSVVRLGIYQADLADIHNTSLVIDAGTVQSDSTGAKTLTFTPLTLAAGIYLLAAVAQGSPATNPSLNALQHVVGVGTSVQNGAGDLQQTNAGIFQSGITGALPANIGSSNTYTSTGPYLLVN